MRRLQQVRWFLLALLLSLVPASSYAGVFISVGFAPPVLPVYVQPPCPEPGLMWAPGYWAYGDDGYYWVPGAWVPAPYIGALWTPPYWGWDGGLYVFHPGYWGPEVGYYGGVNYGFGYLGVGFVGGMWRDHDFYYNRAAWRVDEHRIHEYYEDRRDWDRHWVERDSRTSYSGGPGGIRHDPDQRERMAMRDQHIERTSYQEQHQREAMNNRNAYARFNGGRPANVVANRPLPPEQHPAPQSFRQGQQNSFGNRPGGHNDPAMQNRQMQQQGPGYQNRQQANQGYQNQQMQRANPGYQPRSDQQQGQGYQNRQQVDPGYQNRQMQRANPGNQPRSYQQQGQVNQNRQVQPYRPEPQVQQRNNQGFENRQMQQRQMQQNRPEPQFQQRGNQGFQDRQMQPSRQPAPQNRQAPAPKDEGKPGPRGR